MKKLFALLLALTMILSLVACGASNETPADQPQNEPTTAIEQTPTDAVADQTASEGTTIRLFMSNSTKTLNDVQALAEKYYQETGNKVIVEPAVKGDNYTTKSVLLMQDTENCPDIIREDGFRVKNDAAAGYLLNLDSYLTEWDGYEMMTDALMDGVKGVDGSVYALPHSADSQVIWYNADVTEAAGLGRDWQPKSWQDVFDAAKAMKAAYADDPDFVPMFHYASSNNVEATSMRTFQVLYAGTGSKLYDYEANKWVVDHAALKDVLGFVDQAWKDDLCSIELASNSSADSVIINDLLPNGKIGMAFTISSSIKTGLSNAGDLWGPKLEDGTIKYAYIPSKDSGDFVTMCGGWTWAIPENSKNKDAAWEFMKYLFTAESQATLSAGYALPTRDDAWDHEIWLSQPYGEMFEGFRESLTFAKFRDSVEGYDTSTALYASAIENVAFGLMSVEEAIANFETEMVGGLGADNVIVLNK